MSLPPLDIKPNVPVDTEDSCNCSCCFKVNIFSGKQKTKKRKSHETDIKTQNATKEIYKPSDSESIDITNK